MWTEKYRPASLDEFRGKTKTLKEVQEWAEGWERGDDPLLLHGPPGSGNTSLVHALANELDLELFETNASDARTKSAVEENLAQAATQHSFTGRRKLILIDEVDGLGRGDRGGKSIINRIMKNAAFPIVLTANDEYANGLRTIRNNAKTVELGKVHTNSVAARLREICEREDVGYDTGALKAIAHRANGDLRSAIHDLESLARKGAITEEDVKQLGYRETEREIFEALKIIFKTGTARTASDATEGLDENHDDLFEWIRENVPREYKKVGDRARAFARLSRADVFRGRMRARQNWTLLKYVYELMTVGVALSKEEKYGGWTRYAYPSKIKKMGKSKAARATRNSIGEKLGEHLHLSPSAATEMILFLAILFRNEEWKENIASGLELEEKEISFIEDAA